MTARTEENIVELTSKIIAGKMNTIRDFNASNARLLEHINRPEEIAERATQGDIVTPRATYIMALDRLAGDSDDESLKKLAESARGAGVDRFEFTERLMGKLNREWKDADLDHWIDGAYFSRVVDPSNVEGALSDLRVLSHMIVKTDQEIENPDSVGRLAAIINLAFDVESCTDALEIYPVYVGGFMDFLARKKVLDEQHWRAFVRVFDKMGRSAILAKHVLVMIECLPHRPAFWDSAETKLDVIKIKYGYNV